MENDMKIDRMAGANMIAASAKEIGINNDVVLSECTWQMGEDVSHEYAHRLDLGTPTKSVRLYFSDIELTALLIANRKTRIEERLRSAIAQLIPRLPSRTYATSI
jgi:hypothetical protein